MKLPLAGTRVLELTHVWSGPLCGQVLADLGAEVIRIESRAHLDIHRRGGPYPEGRPGLDRSGTWNAQNRNKLGCTLDLKQEEGRQLLLELVAKSDVLIENFTPGTLARLGLGFDVLREANPRLVLLSLSGYGQTGPWRDSLAYGPMMDAATGLSAATTYDDGVPRAVNGGAADVGGALYGCAAVIRALTQAPRVARHLDVSQFEAGVLFVTGPLLQGMPGARAAEVPTIRLTSATREPQEWLAVSAQGAAEITALFDLVGGAAAASGLMRRLRKEGVAACAEAVQAPFQAWAAARGRPHALRELATAGIPAVHISEVADLLADSALAQGPAFLQVLHPETGISRNYGPAIRLCDAEGHPPAYDRPAPRLGGDNETVFGTLLGMPPERIADLRARRVI
jgi:benzylsuccinate CoA-transferase BbsF subunit